MMIEKRYYSLMDAAIYMGVSIETVRNLISDGELFPLRFGRRGRKRYIDKADIDTYAEQCKEG